MRTQMPTRNSSSRLVWPALALMLVLASFVVACDASSSISVVNDGDIAVTLDVNGGERTKVVEVHQTSLLMLPVNFRIRSVQLTSNDPTRAFSLDFLNPIPAQLVLHFDGTSGALTR